MRPGPIAPCKDPDRTALHSAARPSRSDCVPWCIRPNDGMHANAKLLELMEQLFANVVAAAQRHARQVEAPWRRWKQAVQLS